MKLRLMIAVVLLAAAVTCAVFSYGYLDRQSRILTSDIRAALDGEAKPLCRKALAVCSRWERCEPLFCVLIHHNDADALSKAFFFLKQYASEQKEADTRAALCECLAGLSVLMEGERPKFTNFL